MIWINNIKDLQYYQQSPDVPCYCELVVFPADMQLHGIINNGSGSYTLKIYVYSADGLTQYENATLHFSYYFGVNPDTGAHFFNARLDSFSSAMCSHACYILRAVVNEGNAVFDKYTERYCQNNCCDTARGIYYGQTDMVIGGGGTGGPGTITPDKPELPPPPASAPSGDCGEPLIRIISKFDCYDKFSSTYYGTPTTMLSGTTANFSLTKITNLKGRIVRRPREIKRELSYNCRLQQSESKAVYLLEGYEYFPAWKMAEIEEQLHANHIYVDDYTTYKEYQYSGGTPFKQIHKCFEYFKLEAVVEDCTIRQIFGCGDDCTKAGNELYYVIPAAYESGNFYSENKELVAEDYEGLMVYLRGQDGVSDVEDIDISAVDCDMTGLIKISGNAYLPTSLYFDAPNARNRVFGLTLKAVEDVCGYVPTVCKKPVTGAITYQSIICAAPVVGDITYEDIASTTITINGYADWVADMSETNASIYQGQVTFSIKVVNSSIIADAGTSYTLGNNVIGTIGTGGRPEGAAVLNHSNNEAIPDGTTLLIDATGAIRYNGTIILDTTNEITIDFNNLIYNL